MAWLSRPLPLSASETQVTETPAAATISRTERADLLRADSWHRGGCAGGEEGPRRPRTAPSAQGVQPCPEVVLHLRWGPGDVDRVALQGDQVLLGELRLLGQHLQVLLHVAPEV